jgi:hypothetical protein
MAHDIRHFRFLPPERWDLKCSPPEKPWYQRRHNVLQVAVNRRSGVAIVANFSEDVSNEGEKRGTCLGEHNGPYRRRRVLQVDVVRPYSGLRKTQVQIESRTNSCSFHPPLLQTTYVVIGSKDTLLLRVRQLVPPEAWRKHVQKPPGVQWILAPSI